MKLRWQLLIITLISLLFPLSVWYAFRSINSAFQMSLGESTGKQMRALNSAIEVFAANRTEQLSGFRPARLSEPLVLDGADNEWQSIAPRDFGGVLQLRLARVDEGLALYIAVRDASAQAPAEGPRDRVMLAWADARGIDRLHIERQAEGPVEPAQSGAPPHRAFWHESGAGYALELLLERPDIARLGVLAVDQQPGGAVMHGTVQADSIHLWRLVGEDAEWQNLLAEITPPRARLILRDADGFELYRVDRLGDAPDGEPVSGFERLMFNALFGVERGVVTDENRFYADAQRAVSKFSRGEIELISRLPASLLQLADRFMAALGWVMVIVLLMLVVYLVYALILTFRIKRLNAGLERALDEHGHLRTVLPSARAGDEIGDLSRGMSQMLNDINDYTEYLKQLGSRLSHEMRTPLVIVQTSLENMQLSTAENRQLLTRAMQGTERLRFILNQLSELSRLKVAISESDTAPMRLDALVGQLVEAYRQTGAPIEWQAPDTALWIRGNADLLAQMMDKLIDNARDFSRPDGRITVAVQRRNGAVRLRVGNTGSQLPAEGARIFDSLTSVRGHSEDGTPHLGIGLHIVKLIVQHHAAQIEARNDAAANAVYFTIDFDAADPPPDP